MPETLDVWLAMIAGAERSLDLSFFYASDGPGGRLSAVLEAIEQAAARGVLVRGLFDAKFYETYPETIDRLEAVEGIETRLLDLREHTGGVQHAKYFVVDARDVYLGSANFDWRSLEHIQEIGLRLRSESVANAFLEVFRYDWALAAGDDLPELSERSWQPIELATRDGAVRVTPVFSPESLLPRAESWDLPRLVEWIEAAENSVSIQLLSYKASSYDKRYFGELEGALRGAALRGVSVRLLLADWSKRRGQIEGLQSLQVLPNVEVRLASLPEAASGFVPFARVVHAKFMVVDSQRAWLGTSNWSRDYTSTEAGTWGCFSREAASRRASSGSSPRAGRAPTRRRWTRARATRRLGSIAEATTK